MVNPLTPSIRLIRLTRMALGSFLALWILGWIFSASLLLAPAMLAWGQQPAPTPAQLEEKAQAEDRAMVIVRQRELEMTRLVALYANKVDKLTEENARLQIQRDAKPECPPLPEPTKEHNE